uniref:Uncharacterized protein n=1 Tax=Sphaerodactylus townsendi TaxID=933632 RepID=A0ACB8EMS3_9SAUR
MCTGALCWLVNFFYAAHDKLLCFSQHFKFYTREGKNIPVFICIIDSNAFWFTLTSPVFSMAVQRSQETPPFSRSSDCIPVCPLRFYLAHLRFQASQQSLGLTSLQRLSSAQGATLLPVLPTPR